MRFKNNEDRALAVKCFAENMNEEFRATLQYICHRISARHQDEVLADSFKSAALDEMSHILFFSDVLAKCGEQARFTDWPIDRSDDIAGMLKSDIALEQKAGERYRGQLELFADYPELTAILKSVLADEVDHEEIFKEHLQGLHRS